MKKGYEAPDINVVIMDSVDVITGSRDGDNDSPFPLTSTLAASDTDIILS